jgi:hypothetical protein
MVERLMPGLRLNGATTYQLDESNVQLGNPLATRSMGTLNTAATTPASLTFTVRAPNYTNGTAEFYWTEFTDAIVVLRSDYTGVTTGAGSVYPQGTAALCNLPNPGSGKVWRRINAATYVNPSTGKATRGQDTSWNNNATATGGTHGQVSLRPQQAIVLLRVTP